MCQYSAENGTANDWHLQHLGIAQGSGTDDCMAPSRRCRCVAWDCANSLKAPGWSDCERLLVTQFIWFGPQRW